MQRKSEGVGLVSEGCLNTEAEKAIQEGDQQQPGGSLQA